MMMEQIEHKTAISSEEIERCIAILLQLILIIQIFDIPKEATNGFNKSGWNVFQTGSLTNFLKKKRWKSGCQTQMEKRIEPQENRNRRCGSQCVYGAQIIGAQ
jgi:hypothetical protein